MGLKLLIRVFAFIYLFSAVNREFLLFGIDLRYVNMCLGIMLILWAGIVRALNRDERIPLSAGGKLMLLFYACVVVSNLGWQFSDVYFNEQLYWNLIILNGYNLVAFLVFALWMNQLDKKFVLGSLLVACFVLSISVFAAYAGVELPAFFISDSVRISSTGGSFRNLFGQEIRAAGFAEDANYATLSFIAGAVSAHLFWRNGVLWKYSFLGLMAVGVALAFSRTIIIGSMVAFAVVLASRYFRSQVFFGAVVMGVSLSAVVALTLMQPDGLIDTLQTRLTLWGMAAQLFQDYPILGGGVGSARCFISMQYGLSWFVQCHSTWWQCLSECGLASTFVLGMLFLRNMSAGSKSMRFLVIVFFAMSLTFEVVYLQWFVVILFLVPNAIKQRDDCMKEGAETCVANGGGI